MNQANKAPENLAQDIKEPDDIEPQKMEQEPIEEKDSTLKFIEAVKKHKCIWDMQSEEYYNKTIYRAAWKSLLTPSEVPVPNQPMDSEQKAELKLKVAELQKVWVDLRDSYYKNEDPGRKYKDSLRFLHTAFQSREMEALLEFDEPSWDLMDLRTWNAKKKHIPRANRITDPAPEYEKERLMKRPRLSYHENLALERAKRKAITEKKTIAEENATDIENASGRENATDTDKRPDKVNVTLVVNAYDKGNVAGTVNATGKKNVNGIENVTYKENVTLKENGTEKDNTTDKEKANGIENRTGTVNTTDTKKVIIKKNVTGIDNANDKRNVTGTKIATDVKATNTEIVTEPLSILEKAMRLYELDNPGVWSSDEDESVKASRTYAESTTQTDETKEFPNMPIPI